MAIPVTLLYGSCALLAMAGMSGYALALHFLK